MEELLKYQLTKLHKLLTNPKAIELLFLIYSNERNAKALMEKLGVKERTFYYLIGSLKEAGLIRGKGKYGLTITGYYVITALNEVKNWLNNLEEIKKLDEMIKSSKDAKVSSYLLKSLESIVGISNIQPIKVYADERRFKEALAAFLTESSSKVKAAISSRDLEALLNAANLMQRTGQVAEIILDSSAESIISSDVSEISSNSETQGYLYLKKKGFIWTNEIKFTFAFNEEGDVYLEILSPKGDSFFMGVQLKSRLISEMLDEVFEGLKKQKI